MNKKLFFIFIFLIPVLLSAHKLLLNVYDNEDNTITVEGIFTTGELASGAQIKLESLETGEVLYKKRLPDIGELVINIPKKPYKIILDGGPQHLMEKDGIPPLNGFPKELSTEKKGNVINNERKFKDSSKLSIIVGGLVLAFLLFILTIFISIHNTNKIIKELKGK